MPKGIPAPGGREHRADGSEAAKRLCSFFGEDQAELLDIHREDIPSVTDTRRNGLPEGIVLMIKFQIDTRRDT